MKTYLGDGVYADVEHGDVVLTTENGISTTNRIVLEPAVIALLIDYLRTLRLTRWAAADDDASRPR